MTANIFTIIAAIARLAAIAVHLRQHAQAVVSKIS